MSGGALRVAMILYGELTFDSRVQREANSLVQAGHAVMIFCLKGSPGTAPMLDPRVTVEVVTLGGRPGLPHAPSPFLKRAGLERYAARIAWLVRYARNLRTWGGTVGRTAGAFDVWHAHDFTGLVAASFANRTGSAVVYDSHDLLVESDTGARLPQLLRWVLRRYERRLVRNAELVVAVNNGLAAYHRRHSRPRAMIVVHNCVPAWTVPEPRPTLIRDALGIPPAEPVILYHGFLGPDRGLETLCEAVLEPGLERAHLVLLGLGPHRERLRNLAGRPRFAGRLHVLDSVSPAELLPWVASADVGAMAMPRASLNLYLSTPNKLFECLAAGVPVVISDFPVAGTIVLNDPLGPLGSVCDPSSAHDVARALRSIVELSAESRSDLRRRCAAAARQRWNWESEARSLLQGYASIAHAGEAGGA